MLPIKDVANDHLNVFVRESEGREMINCPLPNRL